MPADLTVLSVCRGRRDLFATASDGGWWVTPPSVVGQQCSFKARYCQHGRSDDRARGRRTGACCVIEESSFRAKADKNASAAAPLFFCATAAFCPSYVIKQNVTLFCD